MMFDVHNGFRRPFDALCDSKLGQPRGCAKRALPCERLEHRRLLAADAGDAGLTALVAANEQLAASGLQFRAEEIEFFSIGQGRPAARLHQAPYFWVENDDRRSAQGNDITYLVDQSDGATASGLTSADTEPAIDRAMETWDGLQAMRKVEIEKRADSGADPDIFDSLLGYGAYGNPFLADIVHAGWMPRTFFETLGGPGGGRGILAVSVTFVFTDENGVPTDVNSDGYMDAALNEVYYNDTFGDPADDRADNPWGIDVNDPGIDVETVALHESGHSFGLGHFGPAPDAVMNPVYAGIRHEPLAADVAGLRTLWSAWGAGTGIASSASASASGRSTLGATAQSLLSVAADDEFSNPLEIDVDLLDDPLA